MSLKELRTIEELRRHDLASVREKLEAVVQAVTAGRAAEQDLEAMQHAAKSSEGVYRDVAGERARDLRARAEAGKLADAQRERLRREESRLLAELERARLDIERQGVKQSVLPILEDLPAASPCAVRWDEMNGDGVARSCPHCQAAVLDVALLDGPQAEALLAARPAGTTLFRRADGTLLAGDCGRAPSRLRFARAAATVVGVLIGLAAAAGVVLSRSAPMTLPWDKSRPMPPLPERSLHIEDSYTSLGGAHSISADIRPSGSDYYFRADVSCGPQVHAVVTLDARLFDAFIGSVVDHRVDPSATVEECSQTDDYPQIAVTFGGTDHTLAIRNCSRQWLLDAAPLTGRTDDLDAAYRSLTAPLVAKCATTPPIPLPFIER